MLLALLLTLGAASPSLADDTSDGDRISQLEAIVQKLVLEIERLKADKVAEKAAENASDDGTEKLEHANRNRNRLPYSSRSWEIACFSSSWLTPYSGAT